MNARRLMLIAATVLFVSAVLIFYRQYSRTRVDSSVRLAMAVESYSRDYVSRGQRVPSSVTLRDLVNSGYISAKEVRAFDGLEVTMYPTASTDPQAILVRVQMPDGVQYVTRADGSTRQELRK
jgi:hypothetical protein